MCYIQGSVEQAISVCPMCKVFKPTASRCPHLKEVCRNRQLHPAHDVIFIKNAEVQTFNGCGYCKWANTTQLPKAPGVQNPGWPGCCRPPTGNEARFIPPADWSAVTTVHKVAPPPEIRAILESARGMISVPPPSRSQSSPKTPDTVLLGTPPKSPVVLAGSTKPSNPQVAIPKGRSNTSPKQPTSPLARDGNGSISRGGGGGGGGSDSPKLPSHAPELRRTASNRDAVPYRESSPARRGGTGPSSRRSLEQESATLGRKGTAKQRAPLSAAVAQLSQLGLEDGRPALKRRSSNAPEANGANGAAPTSQRLQDVKNTPTSVATRTAKRASSVENLKAPKVSPPSSSKGSSGSGNARTGTASRPAARSANSDGSSSSSAFSESTITSEGFTDYLSDESEAELQRQAEHKAEQVAQNYEEDMEFKSARKVLERVNLKPPTSWRAAAATVGARTSKNGYPEPRRQVNMMELTQPSK